MSQASKGKGDGGMKVPSQMGEKGIPPGVGKGSKPSGFVSPNQFGGQGKPVDKGFPGRGKTPLCGGSANSSD